MGDQVSARLAGALERAAVGQRLTSELDQARAELTRAAETVVELTASLRVTEGEIDDLTSPSLARVREFVTGSLDDHLHDLRREIELTRDALVQATGRHEDAQIRVSELGWAATEFAGSVEALELALDAEEERLRSTGDWRVPVLDDLAAERVAVAAEIDACSMVLARVEAARHAVNELYVAVRSARWGPGRLYDGAVRALSQVQEGADDPDAPEWPSVSRAPEALADALACLAWLRVVRRTKRSEIAEHDARLTALAADRRVLLAAPDRADDPA